MDEENFRTAVEFVSKNLEYTSKAAAGVDMSVMDRQIRGYVHPLGIEWSMTYVIVIFRKLALIRETHGGTRWRCRTES
jgi:hypothetical protein